MALQRIPVISAGMIVAVSLAVVFFDCGKVDAPEEPLPRVQQLDGDWVDWDLYDTVDLLTMTLYRNDERPLEPLGHVMYDSIGVNEDGTWLGFPEWHGTGLWDRVILLRRLSDNIYFNSSVSDTNFTAQQSFGNDRGTIWIDLSTYRPLSSSADKEGWLPVRPWIAVRIGTEHYYKLNFPKKPRRFRIIEY